MVTKIQRWGNSQGLRFSKTILDEAQINVGDTVQVLVVNGEITIRSVNKIRGRYKLSDLVSQMPETYEAEEVNWGDPIGNEVW